MDAATSLPISHATVLLVETGEKKVSDAEGYFQFTISPGLPYSLTVHHIAFAAWSQNIAADSRPKDTAIVALQPKVYQSDDIVILSTRLSLEGVRTPFPALAMLPEDLVRHNNTTISDALRNVPGISLVRDGIWETSISMRGMSRSNIVTMVDNARIETANDISGALSLFNVHDLERIETIRSSGAVLHGTGALGGIVHLLTKRAAFTDEQQLHGEFSSEISGVNNCASQYLAVEGSSEHFAVRLSGGYRNADNTATPSGVIPNSQFTDMNLNGSLELRTTDSQTLHLTYQRSQAENTGIPGGSPIAAFASATYTLMQRDLFGLEYTIPNITPIFSSLIVRISQQNIIRNVEIIQSPTLTLTPHAIHSTASAQIESKINVAENNFLVFGVEVWQRTLESKREKINTANNTITGERPLPHSRFLSAGLYGQHEWQFAQDNGSLVVGARYDRIRIGNDETVNPEYIITNGILNTLPQHQTLLWKNGTANNESWSVNAGIQYSIHPDLDLLLLASTAFRSPSLEERFQYLTLGDGIHVGNPDLSPEQCISINSGFRWHADNVNVRGDLFLNRLRDLVSDVPGIFEGSAAFIKRNISKARLYGYELTAEHPVTNHSALKYSLSYVRGEDTGNRKNLPQIPPLHGSIELTAHYQNAGSLSVTSTFSTAQTMTALGETRSSGYSVFDIDAVTRSFTFAHFSFTARGGIQNIFNKAYHNHLSTLRGFVTSEPGRNFFLSLSLTL